MNLWYITRRLLNDEWNKEDEIKRLFMEGIIRRNSLCPT